MKEDLKSFCESFDNKENAKLFLKVFNEHACQKTFQFSTEGGEFFQSGKKVKASDVHGYITRELLDEITFFQEGSETIDEACLSAKCHVDSHIVT